MLKLGIIGAMEEEIETLLSAMTEKASAEHAGSVFYAGKLENTDVVVVKGGIGKVNAALCAQILCSCYQITHLVNTGIAGSLSAKLDIGDLVISRDAMYHDFDCHAFGYPVGLVPGMPLTYPANDTMIAYAREAAEQIQPGHCVVGRIASGDQFVCDTALKDHIIHVTEALCTEMEGAAIAQTAYRNKIPFVILRAISDKADDSAEMDYPSFEKLAAHRCADVTKYLARKLQESAIC